MGTEEENSSHLAGHSLTENDLAPSLLSYARLAWLSFIKMLNEDLAVYSVHQSL